MSEFHRSVASTKVPPGSMMTLQVNGEDVLIANVAGKYYGIGAICKHEEWDLSEGTLKGTTVTCAGHGTVWDLKTGHGQFDEPLEDEPLYDVKEEKGYLYVRKK